MPRPTTIVAWTLATGALAAAAQAGVEDDLNARWRGRWAIVAPEVASDCLGLYTNNEVRAGNTLSKGDRSFAAGEAARVERVDLKGGRIDVFLDLAEPVLLARRDGPFELYDEKVCKVQLQVPLPEATLRQTAAADAALAVLLARHPDRAAAEADGDWNRRRREAYPADYDERLAEYELWKATQVNAAIERRLTEATEEATRVADRLRRNADWLDGFAAGVEEERGDHPGDCPAMLTASLRSGRGRAGSPPGSVTDRRAWEQGFEEGQRWVFALELVRRLPGCRVPIPPR